MSSQSDESILEKLKGLPPERVAEVEGFVDFLRVRAEEQRLVKSATKASEPAYYEFLSWGLDRWTTS